MSSVMPINEPILEAVAIEWSGEPPALPRGRFGGQGWDDAIGHWAALVELGRAELHIKVNRSEVTRLFPPQSEVRSEKPH